MTDPEGDRLREWVIACCMTLLCVIAVWTVFGGDLDQLVIGQPPEAAPAVRAVAPAKPST